MRRGAGLGGHRRVQPSQRLRADHRHAGIRTQPLDVMGEPVPIPFLAAVPRDRPADQLRLRCASPGEGQKIRPQQRRHFERPSRTPRLAELEVLSGKGELYLIELQEPAGWRVVGDAALIPEDVPIVIGRPEDRSRGIGTEVLQLLLLRARALGWTEIRATGIVPANYQSRRLFERAGFVEIPAAPGSDDAPIAMIKSLAP